MESATLESFSAASRPSVLFFSARCGESIFKQLPRNHQPLDFAGAFPNRAQLHVAIELFRGIVFDETITPMNLYRFIRTLHCYLTGIQFGHGGFHRGFHPRIFHAGCTHCEQACGVNFSGHVRKFPLYGLEFADQLSKLLTLFGVLGRSFISSLCHPESESGNRDSATVQDSHRVDEPIAFLAYQRFFRHPAIFKDQFRGIACAQTELVFFFASTKALRSFLYNEGRESVRVCRPVSNSNHHSYIGVTAIGDERFCSVQDPAATLLAFADRTHTCADRKST